jgi:hypothetical protein
MAPGRLDRFQRAAVYVDRILRGAKPAELPLERPTKFELVINLKAAKALRLVIPQSVLLQADEVIQQLRISWRVPRRLAGVPNITLQRPGARDAPPAAERARWAGPRRVAR